MQLLPGFLDLRMTLLDRVFQDLDLRVGAPYGILKLYLQAKLVRLELIIFMGFIGDGLQQLIDQFDRRSLTALLMKWYEIRDESSCDVRMNMPGRCGRH